VASDQALYGVWLEGQKHFKSGIREEELVDTSNPILKMTKNWLEAYFKGDHPSPDTLPLADRGTTFQLKVWSALRDIPVGESRTYSQIGKVILCQSAQAVGTAVGKNPWLILVPCHRVLPSSGHIGKYALKVEFYHKIDDNNEFIPGAGMVIQIAADELLFIGYGYRVELESLNEGKQVDFLSLEKGIYDENCNWKAYMDLNGDEQHIRLEEEPSIIKASFYEF